MSALPLFVRVRAAVLQIDPAAFGAVLAMRWSDTRGWTLVQTATAMVARSRSRMSVTEVIPVAISTASDDDETTAVSPGADSAAVIPPMRAMRSAALTVVARWCTAAFSTCSAGALNTTIAEAPLPGFPEHFPAQKMTDVKKRDDVVDDSTWQGIVMRDVGPEVACVVDVDGGGGAVSALVLLDVVKSVLMMVLAWSSAWSMSCSLVVRACSESSAVEVGCCGDSWEAWRRVLCRRRRGVVGARGDRRKPQAPRQSPSVSVWSLQRGQEARGPV